MESEDQNNHSSSGKRDQTEFIGGIDTMKEFGVKLVKINNIETSLINKIYTDEERINKALVAMAGENSKDIEGMIREYDGIFMASKFDLGFTNLVRHEMRITGGPIMQHPRRQPMHMEKRIEELIKELKKANVIRCCKSPWNAPLVIVGKKDGSIRMCVDYRGLNSITEKESFPMPNTKFLLDCLANAKNIFVNRFRSGVLSSGVGSRNSRNDCIQYKRRTILLQ